MNFWNYFFVFFISRFFFHKVRSVAKGSLIMRCHLSAAMEEGMISVSGSVGILEVLSSKKEKEKDLRFNLSLRREEKYTHRHIATHTKGIHTIRNSLCTSHTSNRMNNINRQIDRDIKQIIKHTSTKSEIRCTAPSFGCWKSAEN